jgi:hypothetical protein
MKEPDLRKWHRIMGITLALFIVIQAGSGLLLSLEDFFVTDFPAFAAFLISIHRGGGNLGTFYRVLLGMGLMGMASSGILIYLKIMARTRKN